MKMNLTLDILQWLICHKTRQNQNPPQVDKGDRFECVMATSLKQSGRPKDFLREPHLNQNAVIEKEA